MPTDNQTLELTAIRLVKPEPYWRTQLRLPSPYCDTGGMLADLYRRLLTRIFNVRWRLTVHFHIEADVTAPDQAHAAAALEAPMYAPGTLMTLSRTHPGATPPWRILGLAQQPLAYIDYGAEPTDDPTVWRCMAQVVVAFTVDVAEASWTDERYAVGVAVDGEQLQRIHAGQGVWVMSPARRFGLVSLVAADAVWVLRRFPVRRDRRQGHVELVLSASPGEQAPNEPN
jgi:hypothetical protein